MAVPVAHLFSTGISVNSLNCGKGFIANAPPKVVSVNFNAASEFTIRFAPILDTAFRGKINEPSYVRNIAEWAAQYYQVDYAEVQNITTQNAQTVYKICNT